MKINDRPGPGALIFDLDGTLWDTTVQCAAAWNRAVEQLGVSSPPLTPQDIAFVTGQPFDKCVSTLFPDLDLSLLEDLTDLIGQEEKKEILSQGGRIYNGVADGLAELNKKFPIFLVSNCREWYMDFFLSWSGLSHLFMDFENYERTALPKSANILRIIETHNLTNPVYVGDTSGDRAAADKAGVLFIHIRHGFGRPESGCPGFDDFFQLVDHFSGY